MTQGKRVPEMAEIPIEELIKDREESLVDIQVCENALLVGIHAYSGGSTRERLEVNKKIVAKIDAELERRKLEAQTGREE